MQLVLGLGDVYWVGIWTMDIVHSEALDNEIVAVC